MQGSKHLSGRPGANRDDFLLKSNDIHRSITPGEGFTLTLHAPRRRFEIHLDCDKRQSACHNRFAPIRSSSADSPEGKPAPRPTIELTSSRLISDYSLFKEHTEQTTANHRVFGKTPATVLGRCNRDFQRHVPVTGLFASPSLGSRIIPSLAWVSTGVGKIIEMDAVDLMLRLSSAVRPRAN